MQNSGPWDLWLTVVENSRLFAQRMVRPLSRLGWIHKIPPDTVRTARAFPSQGCLSTQTHMARVATYLHTVCLTKKGWVRAEGKSRGIETKGLARGGASPSCWRGVPFRVRPARTAHCTVCSFLVRVLCIFGRLSGWQGCGGKGVSIQQRRPPLYLLTNVMVVVAVHTPYRGGGGG